MKASEVKPLAEKVTQLEHLYRHLKRSGHKDLTLEINIRHQINALEADLGRNGIDTSELNPC